MNKVLFVTYNFPPAAGAAVNRILKFYKYLPEYGWEPIILTVDGKDYTAEDQSLLNDIRNDTYLIKTKEFSLVGMSKYLTKDQKIYKPRAFIDSSSRSLSHKILSWFKYNIIPDSRIGWILPAYIEGSNIIQNNPIDLIFSSSPPQTNHVIASLLSKKFKIPWVADFRDPWTGQFWLSQSNKRMEYVNRIDKHLERKVIDYASQIVTISNGMKHHIQDIGYQDNIHVIYNGYDEEINPEKNESSREFHLVYTGSLSYQHKVDGLFAAISSFKESNPSVFQQIKISFMGSWGGFLEEKIKKYELSDKVGLIPFASRSDVEMLISSADCLIVLGVENTNYGVIPSKIFDYIAAEKPILAYGLEEEARSIIEALNIGEDFLFDDVTNSANYILKLFQEKKEGQKNEIDSSKKDKYSRRYQTGQLADVFNLASITRPTAGKL